VLRFSGPSRLRLGNETWRLGHQIKSIGLKAKNNIDVAANQA
jgi:hypothetical protein